MVSAEKLSNTNKKFKNYKESNNLSFKYEYTKNFVRDVYDSVPTVYDYYNKPLILHRSQNYPFKEEKTLFEFMIEGPVSALLGDNNAVFELFTKAFDITSDFQKIAHFFVWGSGKFFLQNYIYDTHNIKTYYNALISNGF
jgi:hypothetical protein